MNKGEYPWPTYIIIPAGGSLVGDIDILKGKSVDEVNAIIARILTASGARRVVAQA